MPRANSQGHRAASGVELIALHQKQSLELGSPLAVGQMVESSKVALSRTASPSDLPAHCLWAGP
jgi:hypothetical protein